MYKIHRICLLGSKKIKKLRLLLQEPFNIRLYQVKTEILRINKTLGAKAVQFTKRLLVNEANPEMLLQI